MNIEKRRAELAEVLEGFPAAYDRVLELFGFRLPKHLAYAIGWYRGLSKPEQEKYGWLYGKPIGIGEWLASERYDRDPSLARIPTDPPELVPVFEQSSRWGLWFNDPAELPRMIVEADELEPCAPTVLQTISLDVERRYEGQDGPSDYEEDFGDDDDYPEDWFNEVEKLESVAYKREKIAEFSGRRTRGRPDPIMPWIDGWSVPDALRAQLHKLDDRSIATAREKLATEPGWALVVGHTLHRKKKTQGTKLLIEAYEALGRHQLAAILTAKKATSPSQTRRRATRR